MSWRLFTVDYSGTWANGAMHEVAPDRILFVYGGSEETKGNLRVMNLRVSVDPPMLFNDDQGPGHARGAKTDDVLTRWHEVAIGANLGYTGGPAATKAAIHQAASEGVITQGQTQGK